MMMNDGVSPTNYVEEVPCCPNCSSTARNVLIHDGHDLLISKSDLEHRIVECTDCGWIYLTPRPKPDFIQHFYPSDEYYPVSASGRRAEKSKRIITRLGSLLKKAALQIVSMPYRARFGSPTTTFEPFGQGRLLDVGCGGGEYLLSMKALGWEVYGCDLSQQKITYTREVLGLENTICATLSELEFPDGYFDTITAWHVIEHLYDPAGELRDVHRLLRTGGRLVLGTPNPSSFEARFFGRWWIGYEIPRHLILFTPDTLSRALKESGFKVSRIRPSLWAASLADSIAFFCKGALGQNIWDTKLHRALYYLLYPVASLSNFLGNWGIMEVTAEKTISKGP